MSQMITKYECARIIGLRAAQLGMSAPFLVTVPESMKDNFTYVATKELKEKALDIQIRRPLPHNKYYNIHIKDMELPDDMDMLLEMFTPEKK